MQRLDQILETACAYEFGTRRTKVVVQFLVHIQIEFFRSVHRKLEIVFNAVQSLQIAGTGAVLLPLIAPEPGGRHGE